MAYIANSLGAELYISGKLKEAKKLLLCALGGRRNVHGDEHKKTLESLYNLGGEKVRWGFRRLSLELTRPQSSTKARRTTEGH